MPDIKLFKLELQILQYYRLVGGEYFVRNIRSVVQNLPGGVIICKFNYGVFCLKSIGTLFAILWGVEKIQFFSDKQTNIAAL